MVNFYLEEWIPDKAPLHYFGWACLQPRASKYPVFEVSGSKYSVVLFIGLGIELDLLLPCRLWFLC